MTKKELRVAEDYWHNTGSVHPDHAEALFAEIHAYHALLETLLGQIKNHPQYHTNLLSSWDD